MVLFLLMMKAEMEGIASVSLRKDCNICMDVKNPLSDTEIREKIVLNPSEYVEQDESSREPPNHFALKWGGNKKYATMTVLTTEEAKTAIKKKGKKKCNDDLLPGEYVKSGEYTPILAIECRGIEPISFHVMGNNEFIITSTNDTVFNEEIDLSDYKDGWADYDAEYDTPVSLSDIEFQWQVV